MVMIQLNYFTIQLLSMYLAISIKISTDQDGTGPDGTGLDGTGLDGTGLDGTGLDGTIFNINNWYIIPSSFPIGTSGPGMTD